MCEGQTQAMLYLNLGPYMYIYSYSPTHTSHTILTITLYTILTYHTIHHSHYITPHTPPSLQLTNLSFSNFQHTCMYIHMYTTYVYMYIYMYTMYTGLPMIDVHVQECAAPADVGLSVAAVYGKVRQCAISTCMSVDTTPTYPLACTV